MSAFLTVSSNAATLIATLPSWLGEATKNYLLHDSLGLTIREVSRARGVHPSTILRQVRKIEAQRNDPLLDMALSQLGTSLTTGQIEKRESDMATPNLNPPVNLEEDKLQAEILRVLRRLREKGAVLAVAKDLNTAVIVRDGMDGTTERLGVADTPLVMSFALEGWISTDNPDLRIVRYRITTSGRNKLNELLGNYDENLLRDFDRKTTSHLDARLAQTATESPLMMLARRRERDGKPFLKPELVRVAETLREKFEIAVLNRPTPALCTGFTPIETPASMEDRAYNLVALAFEDLGPGLADVVYRTCCLLQGLEKSERALGWSARSGKIVLRIALQRLAAHFENVDFDDAMIG